MATKKTAPSSLSIPGKKKTSVQAFELAILVESATSESDGETWLPIVEGHLTHTPGANHTPFAGYFPGSDKPITGVLSNFLFPPGIFDAKPVGRPKTAAQRDVAVFLAYAAFELFNPEMTKEDLRQLVVKAWNGLLPDFGFTTVYRGIKENVHVKRSINNALKFAPELAAPVRSLKNLRLFKWDDTLAGSLIEFRGTRGLDWEMVFSPSPGGQPGEPESRDGYAGLAFADAEVWVWRVGEEYAIKQKAKMWRPESGYIRVIPT